MPKARSKNLHLHPRHDPGKRLQGIEDYATHLETGITLSILYFLESERSARPYDE